MTVLANGPTRVLDAEVGNVDLGKFPEAAQRRVKYGLAGSLGLDGPFLYNGQVWSSPGSQERACDAALADYL